MNEKQVIKFLSKAKTIGLAVSAFGVVFGIAGFFIANGFLGSIWGIVFFILGLLFFFLNKSRLKGSEIDYYCGNIAKEFFAQKEGLIRSIGKPVSREYVSQGYSFDNVFKKNMTQTGKDGVVRSSAYQFAVSFIVERSIYYYGKIQSIVSQENYETQKVIKLDDVLTFSVEKVNNVYAVSFNMNSNDNMFILCRSEADAQSFYGDICKLKNI